MSKLGFFRPVGDFIDALVHPSAQRDALTAARHRAFIAPRILGSLAILSVLPAYLLARGTPSPLEITIFAWLIVPILIAYFLSRTGRYEDAHTLSSLALTGLVAAVALMTGGMSSFAAVWLVVVPLEAALSASRRVVAAASVFALAAACFLLAAGLAGLVPHGLSGGTRETFSFFGVISATLYASGLALGAESLARLGFLMVHAEEDRYRLLALNITDVIARHGRNGGVTFISPAAESLFGVRAAELRGHGLFDRVHIADRPAYLTALARAAAGESQSVEFRVRRDVHAQGAAHHVWVEMRCRPLEESQGGGARDVVSVMRDVSERKDQEHALDQARAESERANAAKSRFLATMSHELRTPLNAIIGFSEMLSNEAQLGLDAPRRGEYARLINESGHHLLAVVNDVLDMSKMEAGDFEISPEPFSPREVIARSCEMLALKARDSGVELSVDLPANLPDMVADKRALKQIMLNLVANAVKFTDRGGRVKVVAGAEASRLVILVEDTGIGISEADLVRVGDPFFQARSAYNRQHDGTGLGLSIVKGLVDLHGGELNLDSRVGQGTRVTVRLPLDCERRQAMIARPDFRQARRAEHAGDTVVVKKSA
ncbi:MAG TPA: ATP-binding protein [Pseudorhodoplanes sp.]|nr:ATP-binding protein [Pseudorhodoplanes sp.]